MVDPARHFCFGTQRHFTEVTRDEFEDITRAMEIARYAFLGLSGLRSMAESQSDLRAVVGKVARLRTRSFQPWEMHELEQAVLDAVRHGDLIFVPRCDELLACVEAIQQGRQKRSAPGLQPKRFDPGPAFRPVNSNAPRVPQNLALASYSPRQSAWDVQGPLGEAQPFAYSEHLRDGDMEQMAARGLSGAEEAECDAIYEAEMTACIVAGAMYRDPRTYALCKQRAFQNYQACRGY